MRKLPTKWYCLITPPQKAFIAEAILRRLGVAAFVPLNLQYPRKLRKRRMPNMGSKPKKYPIFGSRYVFAGFDGVIPMFELKRLHIIRGVVSIGDKPCEFTPQAIDHLARFSDSFIQRRITSSPQRSLQVGDQVSVKEGAFEGHVLHIVAISGSLAQFYVKFFGKTQAIELSLDHLDAA